MHNNPFQGGGFNQYGFPNNMNLNDLMNQYMGQYNQAPGGQNNGGFPYTQPQNYTNPALSAKEEEMRKMENNPNSAHYYKRIGNEYFKKGLYAQAIENYSKAIQMDESESIFYSNRARSYKYLGELEKAYNDAKVAIELDDQNIKGYLLLAQILAELGKFEPGFDKLNRALGRVSKALDLCVKQKKPEFEKDLRKNYFRIKKLIWYKQEEKNKHNDKNDILCYALDLIEKDSTMNNEKKEELSSEIYQSAERWSKVASREVPDHLCCTITMELMEDPVMTSAGITYENSALQEHFKRNGNFDPVTRDPVNPAKVIKNKTMREAIEGYLNENPWAFEYRYDENYLNINF